LLVLVFEKAIHRRCWRRGNQRWTHKAKGVLTRRESNNINALTRFLELIEAKTNSPSLPWTLGERYPVNYRALPVTTAIRSTREHLSTQQPGNVSVGNVPKDTFGTVDIRDLEGGQREILE